MPKLVSVDDQQPCGLDITISAHYDWSVGKTIDLLFPSSLESKTIDLLFPTSLESQESYLTTGMLPYKRSRSFPQYARLYNAAASPASRLRSAGLVGNNRAQSILWISLHMSFSSKTKNNYENPCRSPFRKFEKFRTANRACCARQQFGRPLKKRRQNLA